MLVSNSTYQGGKLDLTLYSPFEAMMKGKESGNSPWLGKLRTHCRDDVIFTNQQLRSAFNKNRIIRLLLRSADA
ncbi:MAG: hypothetical protein A2X77_00500 [Gammaproteobacteria bacterium GWE2_42_36]|nr:MAG: hypothetical protein A2X77_00500 [Gammaproteobacteria bacterium GWE2_42_36]